MKLNILFVAAVVAAGPAQALDLTGHQPIGAMQSWRREDSAVVLTCVDRSEVRIAILAPDLVRVRAAFRQALPERDHSWALASPVWAAVPWQVEEDPHGLRIATAELEVVVQR